MTGTKGKKIRPRQKITCNNPACGRTFSTTPNGSCPFCSSPLTELPPIGKAHDAKKPAPTDPTDPSD